MMKRYFVQTLLIVLTLLSSCVGGINPFPGNDCPTPSSENNSLIITNTTEVEFMMKLFVFSNIRISTIDCTNRCDQLIQDEIVDPLRTQVFEFNSNCRKDFEGDESAYGIELLLDGVAFYRNGWDEKSLKLNIQMSDGEYEVVVD